MKLKSKKIYLIILAIMIIAIIICAVAFLNKEETVKNDVSSINENIYQEINQIVSEISEEEKKLQEVDEIKANFGITGDTQLYEVQNDYNNNTIAVVKPSIKYKVAFAGMTKKAKPQIEELNNIIEKNHPKYTGIWIENSSREKFLKMLGKETKAKYEIDELRIFKD